MLGEGILDERGKRLVNINPRDKIRGWGRRTYYRYEWEDGKIERKLSLYDPYAQAFYSTLAFKSSCFNCKFRGVARACDITLCDMWNYETLNLSPDILRGGVSGVIVHSELGGQILANAAIVLREISEDVFVKRNPAIIRSPNKSPLWHDFTRDSQDLNFDTLIAKYHLRNTRLKHARYCAVSFVKSLIVKILPQCVKDKIRPSRDNGDKLKLK